MSLNNGKCTPSLRVEDVSHAWHVFDARGEVLGRLASRIAMLLRGKHKATYTPHVACGDYVVVVNAKSIKLTGDKLEQKTYYRHSGYPGGMKGETAKARLSKHPERIIEDAVWGMLPKHRLGRQVFKQLKVYAGPEHPHEAQVKESV